LVKKNKEFKTKLEKKFISSLPSTAIDSNTLTAEEGMLHEVEFISPHVIGEEKPKSVFLKGLIWVKEVSISGIKINSMNSNDFNICYNNSDIRFSELIDGIQIGGERKYGFGTLKFRHLEQNGSNLSKTGFYGKWLEEDDRVLVRINSNNPVWAHTEYNPSLKIKGEIEPLVGRNWKVTNAKSGAGRELESHGICWVPGSIVMEDVSFSVERFGIWEATS